MKRFLLDTGIASDWLNMRNEVPVRFREMSLRGHAIGIGVPVLGELVYGIMYGENAERNMQHLRRAIGALRVWPFDNAAAFRYGELAAELRRIGRVMQTNDIVIAAIALTLGNCTVVTKDSDLAAIPGLEIEDWTVPPPTP